MPCFRDPDNLVYGKAENGGMVFGGYETDPVSRWEDGVPWEHAARSLPPDYERFAPLMAGAIRRFPFLADAEAVRLVCHPDAMTPDANPLPGVRGFWVAAGLSLNGFGGGGGIGQAMAGWITAGDPGVDMGPYRAWRFADTYRDPMFAAALGRETYGDYYRLRYPHDADVAGRPRRLSPLHGRLQDTGAVFGTKAGWERADHHEPGRSWRRSGRDQAAYGWTRPPWFERVVAEGRAVRERAGIIDLSSFGKIDVVGPGALGLLQRVAANDVDRPVGSVVYTPWCDERGGMVADVTVTRLAPDTFRIVTGAGFVASDLAWLRWQRSDDEEVMIRDVSGELATIGLWGPRARDILGAATPDDVTDGALPMRQARTIRVGAASALAARISYAGELGWELTLPAEAAVTAWDRLWAVGRDHGLEPFGYRALDGLRMEKGYRYYGTDMTMLETPFEAGLGALVRLDKGTFIGREGLRAVRDAGPTATDRRLATITIGADDAYLPVYGGEAVRAAGEVFGRVRSVAYGPTVARTIGYVYRSATLEEGAPLTVDVFDERIPAIIAPGVLVDPLGDRMHA
jgi:4-methylaminobutanoate oxidase (formaldehyde-forming)